MTNEQKAKRKESAEKGHIKWIKENCLRSKYDRKDDDYVFISYKSDDFEKVLDDIIYDTCKKYGLKVYFDTAFDEHSDLWITQYYENMCSVRCKAFIAFLDDAYYSSYACLLEMMSRKTLEAGGDYNWDSLFFLPVNIGSISNIISDADTGLGTKRYPNNTINKHVAAEVAQFNKIFAKLAKKDERMRDFYEGETIEGFYEAPVPGQSRARGEMYLNVTQCRKLMECVVPYKNDNDGENKEIVDAIYKKLINAELGSVFIENWMAEDTDHSDEENRAKQEKLLEPAVEVQEKEQSKEQALTKESVPVNSNSGTKTQYWEGFCQYAECIDFNPIMKMAKVADRSWHTIRLGKAEIYIECSFTASSIRTAFIVQDKPEVFAKAEQAQAEINKELGTLGDITWQGNVRAQKVFLVTSKKDMSVEDQYAWFCRSAEILNKAIRSHIGI